MAWLFDRLALVTTGALIAAVLAWLVFHPAVAGTFDMAITGLAILSRPRRLHA